MICSMSQRLFFLTKNNTVCCYGDIPARGSFSEKTQLAVLGEITDGRSDAQTDGRSDGRTVDGAR